MNTRLSRWLSRAAAAALVVAASACSTPTVVNTQWSDPQFTAKPIRSIVVFGITNDTTNRRVFEDAMVAQLANMNPPPDSVPINNLVAIPGTPMAESEKLDNFEFVRTIAAARITMPRSYVRLSAGRESMSEELQTLCFLAGANSIFYCDKLLTTMNAGTNRDVAMFEKLGLKAV